MLYSEGPKREDPQLPRTYSIDRLSITLGRAQRIFNSDGSTKTLPGGFLNLCRLCCACLQTAEGLGPLLSQHGDNIQQKEQLALLPARSPSEMSQYDMSFSFLLPPLLFLLEAEKEMTV